MSLEPLSRTQMISELKSILSSSDGVNLETLSTDALTSLYSKYCNNNFGRFDEYVKSEIPNPNNTDEIEESSKEQAQPVDGNNGANPVQEKSENKVVKSPLAYLGKETISKLFDTCKNDEIETYTKLNNPSLANKKGVRVGNEWFDFDEKGRVERIYAEKPNGLSGLDANSFAILCYDNDDNVREYITYLDKKGEFTPEGTKITLYYDNYGYLTDLCNTDSTGKCVFFSKIESELANCKSFGDLLDVYYSNENENEHAIPRILQYHTNYSNIYKQVVDTNDPNSFDNLIKELYETFTRNKVGNTYIDDIIDDMKSHSNDYNKLSIDIMRVINRGSNRGDNHNESVRLNKKFDETIEQGGTGDCWLIGSLLSYTDPEQNPNGLKIIESLVTYNYDNHTATVDLKGAGKSYTFSFDEIQKSNHLSSGEDDMRVIEIAFDKYRRDLAYNGTHQCSVDIMSGGTEDVINALYKQETISYNNKNIDVALFNKKNTINTFAVNTGNYDIFMANNNKDNQELVLYGSHMYNIIMSDSEYVYFVDPHHSKQEDISDLRKHGYRENADPEQYTIKRLPITDFLSLDLEITCSDIPKHA